MATWAAIEYSHQNNIPVFDFMGAGSPKIEYGVREFKSRFGGNMVEYGRFILIFNPLLYHTAKLGLKLIKKIK
jgi:lipid II:glycine glycyltransferase (peptidoglycan interpeptide bridge formation enzyme)